MTRYICFVIACLTVLSGCGWHTENEFRGTLRGIEPFESNAPQALEIGQDAVYRTDDGRRMIVLVFPGSDAAFFAVYPHKATDEDDWSYSTEKADDIELFLASASTLLRLANPVAVSKEMRGAIPLHGQTSFHWKSMANHRIKLEVVGGPSDSVSVRGEFRGSAGPRIDFTPIGLLGIALGLGPKAAQEPEATNEKK